MSSTPASMTRIFHLDAPCTQVFPLFTPLGERAWVPGWDPQMLSGEVVRGSTFRTRRDDGTTTMWIVSEYDPGAGRISYARLAGGSNMGLVDVRCIAAEGVAKRSAVSVTYTLTATSPEGEQFVREFLSDGHYDAMIAEWQSAISAALAGPSALQG